MPTPTYTALATVTLGSSASSVTFSSIPATYRDLIVICDTVASGQSSIDGRLNGDTGNNYSTVRMFGTGSSTGSDINAGSSIVNRYLIGITNTSRTSQIIQIMDYSATDKHKTILTRNASTVNSVNAHAARYANTSVIDSLTINFSESSASSGSTFSLYGVIA
jgi:hypothetical protein